MVDPTEAVLDTEAMLASDDGGPDETGRFAAAPERGAIIGRYVVLSSLGAGAMGVVLAAYDPELDRKVALKLLKTRGGNHGPARARLHREAQALAKVRHQNVVAVHDVGVHEGQVFVAMEFVEGQTLRQWGKGTVRAWREVVRVFAAAGAGLAAAHEQGLTHRDFKPDNVMLGDDGRVRVMDFGLARADQQTAAPIDLQALEIDAVDTLGAPLTQTGALMGTPAYMAPEQFAGAEVTARADQFAFCVALHEALYGQRPFASSTLAGLAFNVTRGNVSEAPRGAGVPAWLRRVVLRGLGPNPDDRFVDMNQLLTALAAGEARRRRKLVIAGVAAIGLIAAGFDGHRRYDHAQRVAACEAAGATIADAWNDEVRASVQAGFVATDSSHAQTTAARVIPWLDEYARAWQVARTQLCTSATIDETLDTELADKAIWCLDESRLTLESLASELARADTKVVNEAVKLAAGLTPASACLDRTTLVSLPPPPPEQARPLATKLRAELSRARTLLQAGKHAEGLEVVRGALEQTQALDWPPLSAQARRLEGALLEAAGSYAESEAASVAAYMQAARASAWGVAADAAMDLIGTVGYLQARHVEGRRWADHAEVAITLGGDPLGLREATRLSQLAGVLNSAGEFAESKLTLERALAIREATLGPDHPAVAALLANLGNVGQALGEYDRAKLLYQRALAIQEAALGPEHPQLAKTLDSLAVAHRAQKQYPEAQALLDRSLAIRERALGPDHPDVGSSLNNLGNLYRSMGEYERAKQVLERALPIWEQAVGPDHPHVARNLYNLGVVHEAMQANEQASALYGRALVIGEKALGFEHPDVVGSLASLISMLTKMGQHTAAIEQLERAVALRSAEGLAPAPLAAARFELARVLWDAPKKQGRDRARARSLAEQARDGYRGGGTEAELDELAKVEDWLAAHPLK